MSQAQQPDQSTDISRIERRKKSLDVQSNEDTSSNSGFSRFAQGGIRFAIIIGFVSILIIGAADPVAAASSGSSSNFCDIPFVGSLINAAFSMFMYGALALGLLTWVATSFTESLPLPQDTKRQIKQQRNSGIASSLRAVFVPAVMITLLDAAALELPSCISVIPF